MPGKKHPILQRRPGPFRGPFPHVGVVTPVRNRRNWTTGFVERFSRQDYPLFTHYIVDSASTDGTPEAISRLELRSVRLLAAPDSAYWSAATNLGVQQALADGCDYILTINDDAIVAPDFLSSIVQATCHHDAHLVGSVICYSDRPHVIWGVGAYNGFESGNFVQTDYANLSEDRFKELVPGDAELIGIDYLCGNGTLIHRSVFDRIGLYDAVNTPHYHGDTEFTMRAEKAGIPRWVAWDARVYNRFTEEQDGPFAKKNRRFFSLRSANFVKPISFILRHYCPPQWRVRAFTTFLAPYLSGLSPRDLSKALRFAALLAKQDWGKARQAKLIPGTSAARRAQEDFRILLELPDQAFSEVVHPYLFRRQAAATEKKGILRRLEGGRSRRDILVDLLASAEYRHANPAGRRFLTLLAEPSRISQAILQSSDFTAEERAALATAAAERSPTENLRAHLESMRALARNAFKRSTASRTDTGVDPAKSRLRPSPRDQEAVMTVCFNIDVLCMAQLDPKAATGVYRYASSVFDELARRRQIRLRAFFSPGLEEGCRKWQASRPDHAGLLMGSMEVPPSNSVVFYPYFPIQESDPRLHGLPVALTICDLFPLIEPDWFSKVAVENFRRQLHILPAIDHFFCISKATETQLRAAMPGLHGSSSVTHLAAHLPEALPATKKKPGRYFLCVGTIEPRKNLKTVIKAFAQIPEAAIGDQQMFVAGQEGWSLSQETLEALAGDRVDRVKFLGRLSEPDLHAAYRDAEFVVFASLAEGFGLPIVEAFLHGKPVITSGNSSMREVAGDAAILVDPLDELDISKAIERMSADTETRALYARKARERVQFFSWSSCADGHVLVFERLAERSARSHDATLT